MKVGGVIARHSAEKGTSQRGQRVRSVDDTVENDTICSPVTKTTWTLLQHRKYSKILYCIIRQFYVKCEKIKASKRGGANGRYSKKWHNF